MKLIQTRGCDDIKSECVSFSETVLSPIASFGGLYVPKTLPMFEDDFYKNHLKSSYKDLAFFVLNSFNIDIDDEVIKEALNLYDNFDNSKNPVPVVKLKNNLFISELYHGPTRAFKDMALQPFGVIFSALAKKRKENYLIITATSGDTGPAALETFKNSENVKVACLYPDGGTSDVQRLQMITEDAKNLKVIGIDGVFDDAQNALKILLSSKIFNEELKKHNLYLSAANSVNFGRIIFQIIYHIHSYLELVRSGDIYVGEKIYLNIPSGNFGNALGAYYASKMGLPIEKIIISSNENNVLTKLIKTGIYDIKNNCVLATTSPAMDIAKSSNVERVLFDLFGDKRTRELMSDLESENYYELSAEELSKLREFFDADFCTGEEGKIYIKEIFKEHNYLMDPHTATCIKSYETRTSKNIKTIAYSTAEWTKFPSVVASALFDKENLSDQDALVLISKTTSLNITSMINGLFDKKIIHSRVTKKEDIEKEILSFVDIP